MWAKNDSLTFLRVELEPTVPEIRAFREEEDTMNKALWIAVSLQAVALGCAVEAATDEESLGEARLEIATAPPNARCLVLTITPSGGTATTRSFSISPGQPAALSLTGLPLGNVSFREQVFTVPCPVPSGTSATWVGDAISANLRAGSPVDLTFNLRLAGGTSGDAVVHNNFPDLPNAITEYPFGTNNWDLVGGPDGNVWFTNRNANSVGKITPTGAVTSFALPSSATSPAHITVGADGNLWITTSGGPGLVRMTTTGIFTFFTIPSASSNPQGITQGSDGNLWFTEYGTDRIGRSTPSGVITEFALPSGSRPSFIVSGPDGNLWFSEEGSSKIGRISTTGTLTEFALPSGSTAPSGIASGPDGNLWVLVKGGKKIDRVTPTGTITELAIPGISGTPLRLTRGPDQNLWFTMGAESGSSIVRFTTAGAFTAFALPSGNGIVGGVAAGADGLLWFTKYSVVGSIRP
jgi:virginiamycin B lyase